MEQIAANLRRPAGRIDDPNPGAAAGATIPTPPFVFGAKSQQRLITATELVRYYDTVGRNTTAGNLQWTSVMKHFSEQWKALKDKKGGDEPEVPKITKALPIIKWTEAFVDYTHRVIGVRSVPLAYVIRLEAAVPTIGAQAAEHRNAFVSIQAAAEHVPYQLPNGHSRVGYLLDAIQCNDAGLQAAMASIKTDQAADGLRNNFEPSATHLLPYDPVQKKRNDHAGGKRGAADISDTTGEEANVSSFGSKKGTGSTGVSLRYHTHAEYIQLPDEQKNELREWRDAAKGKGAGSKGKSVKFSPKKHKSFDTTKAIASAVEKKVAERMKSMEQDKANEGLTEAYIMSIVDKFKGGTGKKAQISEVEASTSAPAPSLKSIIKRAQNGNGKS
jgi:hypothetical protein